MHVMDDGARGRLSDRVWAVGRRTRRFFVYSSGGSAVCIDSGASARAARRGLERIGVDPRSVSHVFLTHSDFDHAGGVEAFPDARVLLPRAEEPMVSGLRPRRILFVRTRNRLRVPWVPVDDGEIVAAGNIAVRVVSTPGHTVGSTSYLVNDEALFTGDLVRLRRGRAVPSPRLITEDVAEDARSIARLAAQVPSADLLCTTHFGCTADYAYAMEAWRGGAGVGRGSS
jgi:hydroxyacylglutathione hydrolase